MNYFVRSAGIILFELSWLVRYGRLRLRSQLPAGRLPSDLVLHHVMGVRWRVAAATACIGRRPARACRQGAARLAV